MTTDLATRVAEALGTGCRECGSPAVVVLSDCWAEVRRLQAEVAAHVGCHTEAEYGAAIAQAQAGVAALQAEVQSLKTGIELGLPEVVSLNRDLSGLCDGYKARATQAEADAKRLLQNVADFARGFRDGMPADPNPMSKAKVLAMLEELHRMLAGKEEP